MKKNTPKKSVKKSQKKLQPKLQPKQSAQILNKNEIETVQRLMRAALKALEFSYAPYSRFYVASAVLTNDDKIYYGCNVENASYGGTICAERVAINKAVS